jgi:hypothetical protein
MDHQDFGFPCPIRVLVEGLPHRNKRIPRLMYNVLMTATLHANLSM